MRIFRPLTLAAFAATTLTALAVTPAAAQTLSSVFGPGVSPGDRSAEYRGGWNPESGDFAHRLHYQHAFDDTWRLRGIVKGSHGPDDGFDADYVQAELLWQVVEAGDGGFASGLRFDARAAFDGGRHPLGVNWTNQWSFGDGWRLRGIALFDVEVGEEARDGLFFETRAQLSRKMGDIRLALESFNDFGNTDAGFGGFDDQEHAVGPALGVSAGDWSIFAGTLFGVSEAADDTQFRVFIGRDL